MASIWDDDDDQTKPSEQPQQAIVLKDSAAEVDLRDRESVTKETKDLFNSLMICDELVVVAYRITEYVPALRNSKIQEFWNNDIIPALVVIVQQDVKARSVVWQAFTSIRNLAICIHEGAKMVIEFKGSTTAIKVAQKTIPTALENLNASIVAAQDLSTTALATFEEKIKTLFQIMGPKAADYVNQKVEIHRQLEEKYKKKKEVMDELGKQKELLETYNNMIHVTESRIKGASAAIEETRSRSRELAALNKEIEKKFQDIPSTYNVRETRKSSNSSYKNSYVIPNPNREVQQQFYGGIIRERVARIRAVTEEGDQQQAIHDDLTKSLVEYKAKYAAARDKMQHDEKTFHEQMKRIQQDIDNLHNQLKDISTAEAAAADTMGLQGQKLAEFLDLVTTLKADVHKGVNAYRPLEAALTATKAMVESHIMLLQEGSDIEVYAAGTKLLQKVAWLQEYHTVSCEHLKPSQEYDAIAQRHTPMAIAMS